MNKRTAEEADIAPPTDAQPPQKRAAGEEEGVPEEKMKTVIYPEMYDKFDPEKIVFVGEPKLSADKSGEILYIKYMYPDGEGDLIIQTPNNMYIPTGVKTFSDGKSSIMLSYGRDWQDNPLVVKMNQIFEMICDKVAEHIAKIGWAKPHKADKIREMIVPIAPAGMDKKTGEMYSPSIRASVVLTGTSQSEFFRKMPSGITARICSADVAPGTQGTSLVSLRWVFRRSVRNSWSFSVRVNLRQVKLGLCEASPAKSARFDACAVVDD